MLSVDEFINKVIGVKWVDRACSFEQMDCWGLVILYYKNVLGIDLPTVIGYESKAVSIQDATQPELDKHWAQCKPENHCIFLAYMNGRPSHVGIVIDNHALHANGNEKSGQVQYNKLEVIKRIYQKVEYYRYANLP